MAVTYKDIDTLSQKETMAGTEKMPVSDTEYITPNQIVAPAKTILDDIVVPQDLSGLTEYNYQVSSSGNWVYYSSGPDTSILLPITPGATYRVMGNSLFAIVADSAPRQAQPVNFATGYTGRLSLTSYMDGIYEFVAPADAAALYLLLVDHSGNDKTLQVFRMKGPAQTVQTTPQNFSADEKTQARTNIGAVAASDIPTVPTNVSAFANDANYAKYYLCADEAAYEAIQNKDSGTLYLIPET